MQNYSMFIVKFATEIRSYFKNSVFSVLRSSKKQSLSITTTSQLMIHDRAVFDNSLHMVYNRSRALSLLFVSIFCFIT